jgi:hypothetical protein
MDLAPLPRDFAQFYLSINDTPTLIPVNSSSPRIELPDVDSETSFVSVILDADDSRPNPNAVFMSFDSLRNLPVSCAVANSSRIAVIMQDDKEFLAAECESLSDSLVVVGVSSCKEAPRTRRPPLTLQPQLAAFLQKYPFANAPVLAQPFLTSVPAIKEILRGQLGLNKFSRRRLSHCLSPAQNVVCVEASKEMLRILHQSEKSHFKGNATGDESQFQNSDPSSKMFGRLMSFQGRGRPSGRSKLR